MWRPMKQHNFRGKVLSLRKVTEHPSYRVLENLEDAVSNIMNYDLYALNHFEYFILRIQLKLASRTNIKASNHNLLFKNERYFIALMGLGPCKLFRPILRDEKVNKIVYLFDVWEPEFSSFYKEMEHWENISIVYFAYKQANEYFENQFEFRTKWAPQAVDINEFYEFRNIKKERIIVQVGRKDDELHPFFLKFSKKYNMDYIYEKVKGEVIAPQRRDYIKLISKASIFVISPQNFSFPERTGSVSPVTAKYYEGYASSALVVGKKTSSDEFDLLFPGYSFVEYKNNEVQFEQEILSMLGEKFDVFERIEKEHTWDKRVEMFLQNDIV